MSWLFLLLAGLLEVLLVVSLKYNVSSNPKPIWLGLTALSLIMSTSLLALALRQIPAGTAYIVWTGIGAIGSLIAGSIFFSETMSAFRLACVLLIVLAVAGLKASADGLPGQTSESGKSANDAISKFILAGPDVPVTPLSFLAKIEKAGLQIKYHVVANGGAENISRGSFSSFATVEGQLPGLRRLQASDFSFGIFIEPDKNNVLCVQNDFKTRLLVEVIATDFHTGQKNFWELIADGKTANWHFRTNSDGIARDIRRVNRESAPAVSKSRPLFGSIARCSGCHTNGGLVMKELSEPHNDWYNPDRTGSLNELIGKFKLAPERNLNDPAAAAAYMLHKASNPEHLAECVRADLVETVKNRAISTATAAPTVVAEAPASDKARIRALLAPLEMNLVSDSVTFKTRKATGQSIDIPGAFFVDELLSAAHSVIKVPVKIYVQSLNELGSRFAADETAGLAETQHAFLIPVRSFADSEQIEQLVAEGKLDKHLIACLLCVDWTTPLYSEKRLALMQYVPEHFANAAALKDALLRNIKADRSHGAESDELIRNLGNPNFAELARTRAEALLQRLQSKTDSKACVISWLKLAAQRRREIQEAQTSRNPRGTILEGGLGPGGFRRIFPEYTRFRPAANLLYLDPVSGLAAMRQASHRH